MVGFLKVLRRAELGRNFPPWQTRKHQVQETQGETRGFDTTQVSPKPEAADQRQTRRINGLRDQWEEALEQHHFDLPSRKPGNK